MKLLGIVVLVKCIVMKDFLHFHDVIYGANLKLDYLFTGGSLGLFSLGLTVERVTINLLRRSNQKGAPSEIANAVSIHPSSLVPPPPKVLGIV